MSKLYGGIVQDIANTINNTKYSNARTSGLSYMTASDFRTVFGGIVDDKIDLADFTLEEVCQKLNGILRALNNIIEGHAQNG